MIRHLYFILSAIALITLVASTTFGQKPVRWGMDETSGAPYIYDNRTKGFESKLAELLAKQLGRKLQAVSGDWDKLPELLTRNDIDLVLNGYEYSENYRKQSSIPYYIYRLDLVVQKDDKNIKAWEDLRKRTPKGSKYKVVVLTGSAAARYLMKTYQGAIELLTTDDVSEAYQLVSSNRADATVQESPSVAYHVTGKEKSSLKKIGEGVAPHFYVILTRPDDKKLRDDIDNALRKSIKDGTLEKIYREYHLWNADQERLSHWTTQSWPPVQKDLDKK